VLVDSVGGMDEYADMKIATRGISQHYVRVSERMSKYADYLVATQCAMMLGRWTRSGQAAKFVVRDEKLAYLGQKIGGDARLKGNPAAAEM